MKFIKLKLSVLFGAVLTIVVSLRTNVRVLNLLGRNIPYQQGWIWQQKLMEYHIGLQEQEKPCVTLGGTIMMLEHDPVYTMGTATLKESGPFRRSSTSLPYDTYQVERAGEATYHGPGQLVVYPILDLAFFNKDIDFYLRQMEQVAIDSLVTLGLSQADVGRVEGQTGVWVGDEKIAAMGIKLRRWVTMHGMSINVNPRMEYFSNIVPCGIRDKGVTSLHQLGLATSVDDCGSVYLEHFAKLFQVEASEILDHDESKELLKNLSAV